MDCGMCCRSVAIRGLSRRRGGYLSIWGRGVVFLDRVSKGLELFAREYSLLSLDLRLLLWFGKNFRLMNKSAILP